MAFCNGVFARPFAQDPQMIRMEPMARSAMRSCTPPPVPAGCRLEVTPPRAQTPPAPPAACQHGCAAAPCAGQISRSCSAALPARRAPAANCPSGTHGVGSLQQATLLSAERVKRSVTPEELSALGKDLTAKTKEVKQMGDQLREAAFRRAVAAAEDIIDTRLGEIVPKQEGLAEQMKELMEKVQELESKLGFDEIGSRLQEVEQAVSELGKNFLRIEGIGLCHLDARMAELEEAQAAVKSSEAQDVQGQFEELSTEVGQKLDRVQQDCHDIRARLEMQEEKGRALRTLHEAREDQLHSTLEQFHKLNSDRRLKSVEARMLELEADSLSCTEQLQTLKQQLASTACGGASPPQGDGSLYAASCRLQSPCLDWVKTPSAVAGSLETSSAYSRLQRFEWRASEAESPKPVSVNFSELRRSSKADEVARAPSPTDQSDSTTLVPDLQAERLPQALRAQLRLQRALQERDSHFEESLAETF